MYYESKRYKTRVLDLEARLPVVAREHGHEGLAQAVSGEIAEIMEARDDCMAKLMTIMLAHEKKIRE